MASVSPKEPSNLGQESRNGRPVGKIFYIESHGEPDRIVLSRGYEFNEIAVCEQQQNLQVFVLIPTSIHASDSESQTQRQQQ